MSEAFKSIEQGLKEAIAHARGSGKAEIHQIRFQHQTSPGSAHGQASHKPSLPVASASKRGRF